MMLMDSLPTTVSVNDWRTPVISEGLWTEMFFDGFISICYEVLSFNLAAEIILDSGL